MTLINYSSKYSSKNIILNSINIDLDSVKTYHLNDFYFNIEPKIVAPKIHNIFEKSPAEKNLFNHLNRTYPNCNICPNMTLQSFIEISKLNGHFTKEEINYLKYCIIDFVIVDKDGYVVKCIELQKGKHHDDKEWIKKDYLKKKCFEVLGIDFSREY